MSSSSSGIGKKRKSEKSENENENINKKHKADCSICMSELSEDPTENKRLKQKMKDGKLVCGHIFHKDCVDNWFKRQKQQNEEMNCPECRTKINQDEWPEDLQLEQENNIRQELYLAELGRQRTIEYRESILAEIRRQRLIEEQERTLTRAEIRRRRLIEEQQQRPDQPVLFMGIVVCMNGQILTKYLNIDLGLGINNTIEHLKTAILNKSQELAEMRGFLCPQNIRRNIHNMISVFGVTPRVEASFNIRNIYFGTPTDCENILQTQAQTLTNNNSTLIDVYKEYQDAGTNNINNRKLFYVTYLYESRHPPTGPEDPGQVYARYYYNEDNPVIPAGFRGITQNPDLDPKSTRHSLSWIVVEIECNTFQNNNTPVANTLGGRKTRNKNKKSRRFKKTKGLRKVGGLRT